MLLLRIGVVMPFYNFQCKACGEHKEIHFNFSDKQEVKCDCGKDMEKVIGAVGVIFRGGGWGGQ